MSRRSAQLRLLLSSQQAYHGRGAQAEISGREAVVSAMAVGLVIDVWRNGPVEDMHCGKRGPDDAAMFAESTSLHEQAVTALTAANRPVGLLQFEEHLLDRERPWAGLGGKTLNDLGYGFLGQYRRHVKDHINRLLDLGHHTCVGDPLEPLLVTTALLYGRHHKGMPRWPVIVERIGILLADPSPDRQMGTGRPRHPSYRGDATGDALAGRTDRRPPVPAVQPPRNGPGVAKSPSAVLRGATIRPAVGRAVPQNLTAPCRHCRQIVSGGVRFR